MKRFNEWEGAEKTEEFDAALVAAVWPNGFECKRCKHGVGYKLDGRKVRECGACGHQSSPIAGTILHSSKLPTGRWAYVAQLVVSVPDITALRLAKLADVHWRTARGILRKISKCNAENTKQIKALAEAAAKYPLVAA